ncbi:hypothetical protein [Rhodoferax saidenbachensis]|uniref:Uncharacterized protein n=1 Tax=Rhodoferax saidenbachensis TaxID=1484693 RepID=A0ABU1ZKS4_9BURK|nr:hypothetical protein [Rhodoferax saidenbachensis]MDR7306150.1 hypothetical protein [Rhodoferax saidenbachensis]
MEPRARDQPNGGHRAQKGLAGFDFTRIGHSGAVLTRQDAVWRSAGTEAEGTQWDCLRDNVSGLWWEAKTNEATAGAPGAKHLRHVSFTANALGPAHGYRTQTLDQHQQGRRHD